MGINNKLGVKYMPNKAENKTSKKKKIITEHTPLTAKEKAFCNKYIELNNGGQALLAAGYKAKDINSAKVTASRLLTKANVLSQIEKLRAQCTKKSIATAQEVMEYFTRVMNGEEKDQFGLEASLSERTKAAQELAKRTVDLDNRLQGKADAVVTINLDWKR